MASGRAYANYISTFAHVCCANLVEILGQNLKF